MSEYQPASCNIGRPQRRRRLSVAAVAFALAAAHVLAVGAGVVPAALLVVVFVPLAFGFEWAVQAYAAFCVRLAFLGRYDFRGDGGADDAGPARGAVADADHRRADRVHAATITAVSVVLAGTTTLTIVVLF